MVYTFTAVGAIDQLSVVKIVGDLEVSTATAAGDDVIGVALQSVQDGENVPVQINDILHGYAAGTIVAGDKLAPTTGGEVITEVTAGNAYNFIALTDAAVGEEVQMIAQKGTV